MAQTTASPLTPAAPPSGLKGAGPSLDPRAALAQMVAKTEMESPAAPEPQDSPTALATDSAPANPPSLPDTAGPDAGQPPLSSGDQTPPGEPAPTEELPPEPTDDSSVNKPTNADLTAALEGLAPEQARQILDLAKTGEIPRIAKLVAQLHQHDATIEAQQARIEELESASSTQPQAAASPDNALPESVSKLKTLADVKQATRTAQKTIDYIENLFEEQPYDGNPQSKQYAVGEQTFSRQELLAEKRRAQAELRALPDRAEQIQTQSRFESERAQARAVFAEAFPWAKDANSAQSQEISECIRANPWMKNFLNPEWMAAQFLYGYKPLSKELELRKASKNGKPATPAAPGRHVTPRVPLTAPSAESAGKLPAARATAARPALENGKEPPSRAANKESFAELLHATGR